jgi:hypothetical protein
MQFTQPDKGRWLFAGSLLFYFLLISLLFIFATSCSNEDTNRTFETPVDLTGQATGVSAPLSDEPVKDCQVDKSVVTFIQYNY